MGSQSRPQGTLQGFGYSKEQAQTGKGVWLCGALACWGCGEQEGSGSRLLCLPCYPRYPQPHPCGLFPGVVPIGIFLPGHEEGSRAGATLALWAGERSQAGRLRPGQQQQQGLSPLKGLRAEGRPARAVPCVTGAESRACRRLLSSGRCSLWLLCMACSQDLSWPLVLASAGSSCLLLDSYRPAWSQLWGPLLMLHLDMACTGPEERGSPLARGQGRAG